MPSILQDYSTQFQFDLTIVIPLGDRLDYFEACLKSICQQKQQGRTEILLLDNASNIFSRTDLEVIFQKYSIYLTPAKYTIHYVRHPQHLDVVNNINWGCKWANSPWIYLVSSNGLLLENTLSWFKDIIQKQSDLDLISGAFYTIDQEDNILSKSDFLNHGGSVDTHFLRLFLDQNPLQQIATLYNRKIFMKAGFFRPELGVIAEWEFFRRISQLPDLKWYYLPQYIGAHRLQSVSTAVAPDAKISSQDVWQTLALSEHYFSSYDQKLSRKKRYQQCLQAVEDHFLAGQLEAALAICFDLVEFSGLGDRLWLETLNQSTFKHKQQIYRLILILSEQQ